MSRKRAVRELKKCQFPQIYIWDAAAAATATAATAAATATAATAATAAVTATAATATAATAAATAAANQFYQPGSLSAPADRGFGCLMDVVIAAPGLPRAIQGSCYDVAIAAQRAGAPHHAPRKRAMRSNQFYQPGSISTPADRGFGCLMHVVIAAPGLPIHTG